MCFKRNLWLILSCLPLSAELHAGTAGTLPSTYAGLWAGFGGSYIYSQVGGNTNITMVSSTPATVEYLLNQNLKNHLAPLVNVGYLFDLKNDWYLGAKVLYKYIGVEQFDQSWSGTFQNGAYQSAGLHTKLRQDLSLLLNGGYQFGSWLVYGGIGPAMVDVAAELNAEILAPTSTTFQPVNTTHSKYLWGGAAQVGFEYMLPNRFMVDVSYNFLASSKQTLPTIRLQSGTAGLYTAFSQQVHVTEQGINVTINKYFG
ncbi:outer membrane protein [Legionella oakridgensis]|uniref:Uncharacterized protein n=2 Tax=Legionella oakridgensis TaxID=29423 RepID=W0BAJ0_9GAMM|nr:outer membrane beta-barrel protein [Legionella oakridgensis]AHE67558.1 hypothetical protein Loa_02014 [Legionella oakridgensis ATCC 33761 = DSM 21215]ETO92804.1 outer membrane protein [Legionella oakridgensis RV-2-2007]KTD37090.1 hypothetical protein Loak_2226 [Legionella oakridgensis]STY20601.1 Opacity protein and related surface antigens [Legionella longbeachae]